MSEVLVIVGLLLHALSGVPGLVARRLPNGGQRIATVLSVIGSIIGIGGALTASCCPDRIVPYMRLTDWPSFS